VSAAQFDQGSPLAETQTRLVVSALFRERQSFVHDRNVLQAGELSLGPLYWTQLTSSAARAAAVLIPAPAAATAVAVGNPELFIGPSLTPSVYTLSLHTVSADDDMDTDVNVHLDLVAESTGTPLCSEGLMPLDTGSGRTVRDRKRTRLYSAEGHSVLVSSTPHVGPTGVRQSPRMHPSSVILICADPPLPSSPIVLAFGFGASDSDRNRCKGLVECASAFGYENEILFYVVAVGKNEMSGVARDMHVAGLQADISSLQGWLCTLVVGVVLAFVDWSWSYSSTCVGDGLGALWSKKVVQAFEVSTSLEVVILPHRLVLLPDGPTESSAIFQSLLIGQGLDVCTFPAIELGHSLSCVGRCPTGPCTRFVTI
jgi:hypothetical protein